MTLSNVVAILVRLLALKLLFDGVPALFSSLGRSAMHSSSPADFIVVALYLVCVGMLWLCALWLGRVLTRGCDATLGSTSLTLPDLYSIAFVCVGLYYSVGSFGFALTWLHFAVTQSSSEAALTPKQQQNFYHFFQVFSQLLIGLVLIFRARRLSTRLLKYDNQMAASL